MSSVRIGLVVGAAALLGAIFDMPHDYYGALRFLICGICIFAAYVSLRERSALAFPFLAVGILFNPILRIHTERSIWIAIDLVVASGFLVTAWLAPRLDAAKVVTFPQPREAAATTQARTADAPS